MSSFHERPSQVAIRQKKASLATSAGGSNYFISYLSTDAYGKKGRKKVLFSKKKGVVAEHGSSAGHKEEGGSLRRLSKGENHIELKENRLFQWSRLRQKEDGCRVDGASLDRGKLLREEKAFFIEEEGGGAAIGKGGPFLPN